MSPRERLETPEVPPEAPLAPPSLKEKICKVCAERQVDSGVTALFLAIADELAALRK